MEPFGILIVALVIGWGVTRIPRAIADTVATAKAATAGRFALVDADRRRRHEARQKWADWFRAEWADRRQRKHEQGGGEGAYKPGFGNWWREQYRAWWQDRIDHAAARRDTRAPYDPNGTGWAARWYERMKRAYQKRYSTNEDTTTYTDPSGPATTGGPDAAQPGQQQPAEDTCPGCGEPLVDEQPRYWRPRRWGPPPRRTHQGGEPFCGSTVHEDDDTYTPPPWTTPNPRRFRQDPNTAGFAESYAAGRESYWGASAAKCLRCGRALMPGEYSHCASCAAEADEQQRQHDRQDAGYACGSCGQDADVLYSTADGGWECSDCADRRTGNDPTTSTADQPGPADTTTATEPTSPHATPTPQGEPMSQALTATAGPAPAAAEVAVNEHARANFQQMMKGAQKLSEAAAMAEQARKEIQNAANATVDGMSMRKFDATATQAADAVAQGVNLGTLSQWCELATELNNAGQAGYDSLDKYRDAEDTVSSNGVDGATLDAA